MQIIYLSNNYLNNRVLIVEPFNVISNGITIISSYTLADLVFSLLKFTGDALTKVKAGLQKTWDGIKAGAEYVTNSVLLPILNSFISSFTAGISAVLATVAYLLPALSYTVDGNSFVLTVNGKITTLAFAIENYNIVLYQDNQQILQFIRPVLLPALKLVETLGVHPTAKSFIQLNIGVEAINEFFVLFGVNMDKSQAITAAITPSIVFAIATFANYYNYITSSTEKSNFAASMGVLHRALVSAAALLGGIGDIISDITNSGSDVWQYAKSILIMGEAVHLGLLALRLGKDIMVAISTGGFSAIKQIPTLIKSYTNWIAYLAMLSFIHLILSIIWGLLGDSTTLEV